MSPDPYTEPLHIGTPPDFANESLRLALDSTPDGHPDRDVIERAAESLTTEGP
jgi:hypothetical protein